MLWVHKKKRLNETILLSSTKHMFKLMDKKIITILRSKFRFTGPMANIGPDKQAF